MVQNGHSMFFRGNFINRLIKNIFIGCLIILNWKTSFGQYDTLKFPIPMENGIISYNQSFRLAKKELPDALFRSLQKWISGLPSEYQVKISQKDENGKTISGSVLFRVGIPETGNFFWLKARVLINVDHDSTRILVRDFYEKPIEKGVTNDYSKIEYRWWDFRNAKPWSLEDEALFKGLDQKTRNLLDSFSQWINH
jgi:hypothetical protein